MFRTFGNTLGLIGVSWRVLRGDGLLMFPLCSGASLLVVLLYVLVAFEYGGTFDRLARGDVLAADFIFLGLAYVAASFVIVYFTAALVAAAQYRIVGGTPDFRMGLESANDRLGAIALWAVIACTVGLVIKQMASSGGIVGRVGGVFAELLCGWATFLVLPVMIVEGSPPVESMRRSTEMFKESWGRHLVGNYGFGLLYLVLLASVFVLAGGLFILGASSGVAVIVALVVFALAAASLKCLETLFVVALYNYATVGESDGAFSDDVLRGAFVFKHARGRLGPPRARHRAAA